MLVPVALLGQISLGQEPATHRVTPPQRAALLALLALADGAVVETQRIVAALWGDEPVASARNVVQVHVVGLRKVLGVDRLRTVSGGYALSGVSTDAVELDRAVSSAARATQHDEKAVLRTLAPWRPLLSAEPLPGLGGVAAFVPGEVERLRRVQRRGLRLLAWASVEDDPADAVTAAELLLEEDPYDEDLHALRVTGLAHAGKRNDALRAWREARSRLKDDLGIDVGPRLQEVQQRVLSAAAPPPGMRRPVRRCRQDHELVGRETELIELAELTRESRVVTVTGLPGVGKSRLVEEYVQRTAGDDVVDVVLRLEGQDAWAVLAGALGLPVSALDGLAKALPWALRGRPARIVLDDAHLGRHVRAVAELLSLQPDVSVLVTSRAPLHCAGEATLVLRGLAARGGSTASSPASRLLVAEAVRCGSPRERLSGGDRALEAIAARVDGHPLGLLLAGRRLGVLSPEQLLQSIDTAAGLLRAPRTSGDQAPRSLEAIVGEALETLPTSQRTLLRAVQVFPTGMPADALLSARLPGVGDDPLDVLQDLVRRGLLRPVDDTAVTRFALPELIRGGAVTLLSPAVPSAAERTWLVQWACELVGRSPYGPVGWPRTYAQLTRWRAESENLRRAIEYALGDSRAEAASQLIVATTFLWTSLGRNAEQLEDIDRALGCVGLSSSDRADLLLLRVGVECLCGRAGQTADLSREAMEAARALDDPHRLVAAYNVEVDRRHVAGEDLLDFCTEIADLLPSLPDPGLRAVALACLVAQDAEPARLCGAARRMAARAGMEIFETTMLINEAETSLLYATREGRRLVRPGEDPGRTALAAATHARRRSVEGGDSFFAAAAEMSMAGAHLLQQDAEDAVPLLLKAVDAFAALSAPLEFREAVLRLAAAARLQGEVSVAAHLLETWHFLHDAAGEAMQTERWVVEGMLADVEPEGTCPHPREHGAHPVVARVDQMLDVLLLDSAGPLSRV